ncbi:unnamed protein product [Prorocentrum cordatum]|uniref:GYF domain-containing protein n=1 Tax=Prorocentrum cordatum TaxID=2364126 RepID=A0ABN9PQH9_9DINO|nr:unnamed protein product [Polarella glacialis]
MDDEASDCTTVHSNVQCDSKNLGNGKEPDKATDIATQTDLKLHHSVEADGKETGIATQTDLKLHHFAEADGTKIDKDDVAAYQLEYFGEADPANCVASSSEQSTVDLDVSPTTTGPGGSEQSAADVAILTTLTDQHNLVQLDEQVVPPVTLPDEPPEPEVQPDEHGQGFDSQGSETEDAHDDVKSGGLELQWECMDARGATQGPFSQEQMREWFEVRALPKGLPMRTNPDTPFMTSGLLFPSPLVPFRDCPRAFGYYYGHAHVGLVQDLREGGRKVGAGCLQYDSAGLGPLPLFGMRGGRADQGQREDGGAGTGHGDSELREGRGHHERSG